MVTQKRLSTGGKEEWVWGGKGKFWTTKNMLAESGWQHAPFRKITEIPKRTRPKGRGMPHGKEFETKKTGFGVMRRGDSKNGVKKGKEPQPGRGQSWGVLRGIRAGTGKKVKQKR